MYIVQSAEDQDIKGVKLSGLRRIKKKGCEVDFVLIMKCRKTELRAQVMLFNGEAPEVSVPFKERVPWEAIEAVTASTLVDGRVAMNLAYQGDVLLGVLVAPSAKLFVRAMKENIRFILTIGTFVSCAMVDDDKVRAFLTR